MGTPSLEEKVSFFSIYLPFLTASVIIHGKNYRLRGVRRDNRSIPPCITIHDDLEFQNTIWLSEKEISLELTPLSKITDEDALFVIGSKEVFIKQNNEISPYYGMSPSGIFLDSLDGDESCYIKLKQADYLRSKGYALSYLDYSVDDLVNFGWIKLKEK